VSSQLTTVIQGGHSPGKPGKPGKVREFQIGQGKVGKWKKSGKLKFCKIASIQSDLYADLM